jgi:hypothetical protein
MLPSAEQVRCRGFHSAPLINSFLFGDFGLDKALICFVKVKITLRDISGLVD